MIGDHVCELMDRCGGAGVPRQCHNGVTEIELIYRGVGNDQMLFGLIDFFCVGELWKSETIASRLIGRARLVTDIERHLVPTISADDSRQDPNGWDKGHLRKDFREFGVK